jgi:hypothetical protein
MTASIVPLLIAFAASSPPIERGVSLGLFSEEATFDYSPLVEEIAELGASHVSIAYVWWQDDLRANEVRPMKRWSPTDEQIVSAMRTAAKFGLQVTTFPILRLVKAGEGEWRGKITPVDEALWWASYERMMTEAARLSVQGGARRLAIGSELLSREGDRRRWLELIERVRIIAPNVEILYSANWDHFREVSFWDAVDVIGVTGYWELTKDLEASEDVLANAWLPVRETLSRFSAEVGRPIIITEVGYPSIDGGAAWPWDQTRKAAIDLEEQRRAYAAFVRTWSGVKFLRGVYFWNWFGFGGKQDGDYTPRKKPAAEIIRAWFSPAREPSSATR